MHHGLVVAVAGGSEVFFVPTVAKNKNDAVSLLPSSRSLPPNHFQAMRKQAPRTVPDRRKRSRSSAVFGTTPLPRRGGGDHSVMIVGGLSRPPMITALALLVAIGLLSEGRRTASAFSVGLSAGRNRLGVSARASVEDSVASDGSPSSWGNQPPKEKDAALEVARELLTAPRVRPTTDDGSDDSSLLLDADVAEIPLLLRERNRPAAGDAVVAAGGDDDLLDDDDTEPLSRHFYMTLPRHSHPRVDDLLGKTEATLRALHRHSKKVQVDHLKAAKEAGLKHEVIYANTYVDLGKINVIGFDFDYTLVTYTEQLLELIYDMALRRLVEGRQYPAEMLRSDRLKFDPLFSIRGLAVDLKTGWITHLSYTHKVAVAWEGREKLPTSRIFGEYRGKRALRPSERRQRLKPLNDLFSMAECCLIADTIQFFKDHAIPYCPQSVVQDVLKVVTETHLSGDFHRIVARDPSKFFSPTPHLESVLENLKASGKKLIFVSNSPYWYVDAGMGYVFGDDWQKEWDAIITSAGKPSFYTDEVRPFREICLDTGRLLFKRVERFEPGKVYTEGCLKELSRLMQWSNSPAAADNPQVMGGGANATLSASVVTNGYPLSPLATTSSDDAATMDFASANVLYVGDSLFADLVDAKREFGWTTAAVTPEVGYEMEMKNQADFVLAHRSIDLLLNALRLAQDEMGNGMRTKEDVRVLDSLERLVSLWRDRETLLLGSPFGSVFSARYQPSLFAHSLRRYCDLYMPSVSCLRHYSPQHRFYPEQDTRLLAHEIKDADAGCWELEDVLARAKEQPDRSS